MGTHRAQINVLDDKVQFVFAEHSKFVDFDSYLDHQIKSWFECCGDKIQTKNVEVIYQDKVIQRILD